MPHTTLQAFAAFLFTLAAPLAAQRTWVVDAANGAGTDFTDLPPAISAAAAGDRILVRKGDYQAVAIGKPLRLVADLGARIQHPTSSAAVAITGIGSGQTLVVQGLEIIGHPFGSSSAALTVTGCAGAVALADLKIVATTNNGGIAVRDSGAVTIATSLVRPSLACERSTVSAQSCLFMAYDAMPGPVTNAVTADQTSLELTQCLASGTNGSGHAASAAAVRLWRSQLVLRGDAGSRYVGGTYNNQPSSPSLDGSGSSTLLADPVIVLTPPPANFVSTELRRLAALTAMEGNVGGRIRLELYSPSASWFALFVALPRPPFAIPPFGNQWMDLPTEMLLTSGVQGAGERVTLPLPVPADSALRGLALTFQAFTGIGPVLALSNPAVPVLH